MKDLSKILRTRPELAVDPTVLARVKSEFDAIEQMGKAAKRGVVWKGKVIRLYTELHRLGFGLPKSGGADIDQMKDAMREVLKEQQPKAEPLQNKTYLRHDEAAEYCAISKKTLADWKKLGYVKDYKINRTVVYKRTDLDEALAKFGRQAFKTPKRRARRTEEVGKTVPPQL